MYNPGDLSIIGQIAEAIADKYQDDPYVYDLNIRVENPEGWLIGHIRFEDGLIRVDLEGYGNPYDESI